MSCSIAPTPRSWISSAEKPKQRPISSEMTATFMACIEALSPAPSVSTRMQSSRASIILSTSARVSDFGLGAGLGGPGRHQLEGLPAGARGLAVLPLAELLRLALRLEAQLPGDARALLGRDAAAGSSRPGSVAGSDGASATPRLSAATARAPPDSAVGIVGGGLGRALRGAGQGAAVEQREVAVLRAPAHPRQAERADRRHLRRGGDAKAAQRERMRHPADVEMHEHPDAQRLDVDLGGDGAGGGLHGMAPRERRQAGLAVLSASRRRP